MSPSVQSTPTQPPTTAGLRLAREAAEGLGSLTQTKRYLERSILDLVIRELYAVAVEHGAGGLTIGIEEEGVEISVVTPSGYQYWRPHPCDKPHALLRKLMNDPRTPMILEPLKAVESLDGAVIGVEPLRSMGWKKGDALLEPGDCGRRVEVDPT